MSIVTDSRRPEEPKDPESCNVFGIARLLLAQRDSVDLAERYRDGAVGYREAKEIVIDAHEQRFGSARERYDDLIADLPTLRVVLAQGAERARESAGRRLAAARAAVGIVGGDDGGHRLVTNDPSPRQT